jgi:hypothetical protein
MSEQNAPLRPYSATKLAALYGIDVRTFERWIHPQHVEIGPRKGNLYNVLQVEIIFALNGWPKVNTRR